MSQTKLGNIDARLAEAAEILYTTTYVHAWACLYQGMAIGETITEIVVPHAEGREDGMSPGDLGMLVYDIRHGRVEVDFVNEPVVLALADALFGVMPRITRWLNPKFLAMLARGEDWFDDLPTQTFTPELVAKVKSAKD
jgi:hypothetical protein